MEKRIYDPFKKDLEGFYKYLAAFLDGEGSIRISKRKEVEGRKNRNYYKEVKIVNTFKPILILIGNKTNGLVKKHRKFPKNPSKHKISYLVRWSGESAKILLKRIFPYLIIKRRQAELYLKFPNRNSGRFKGKDKRFFENVRIKEVQDSICEKFSILNKKGPL